MKLVNRVVLKIDNFEKCQVISDQDCSLGQLYDYACALKAFVYERIKEIESKSAPDVKVEEPEKV